MSYNDDHEVEETLEEELAEEFGDKDDFYLSDLDEELRDKEERLGLQAIDEEYVFDDSYEEEEKKKKKKSKKKKKELSVAKYKLILKVGLVIIAFCLIIDGLLICYNSTNKEDFNVKEIIDKKERPIIYNNVIIEKKDTDNIPVVNISNPSISEINNDIVKTYNEYYKESPNYFRYEYSISKDILSLVLIYNGKKTYEFKNNYYFKTYNISLKTLSKMKDEEVLNEFRISKDKVYKIMKNNINNHYNELIRRNYINENTYTFNKLISDLDLINFTSDINYYVENNRLVVYKPYNINNNTNLTPYFNEDSFKMYIK